MSQSARRLAFSIGLLLGTILATRGAARPNILLILADDLGWKDVGYAGSTYYRTPNIDRLAREGMIFTQGYSAACVCSPSRGALYSGKNPARTAFTTVYDGPGGPDDRLFERSKDRGGSNQFWKPPIDTPCPTRRGRLHKSSENPAMLPPCSASGIVVKCLGSNPPSSASKLLAAIDFLKPAA